MKGALNKLIYFLNPFTSKISLVILLTVCTTINYYFDVSSEKLGIGSANNLSFDIFLYSHHLSAWYCTDIVRRNSFLVTYGVKGSSEPRVMWSFSLFTCLTASCSSRLFTISSGIWRTTLLLFAPISKITGNGGHFKTGLNECLTTCKCL